MGDCCGVSASARAPASCMCQPTERESKNAFQKGATGGFSAGVGSEFATETRVDKAPWGPLIHLLKHVLSARTRAQ